MSATLFSSLRRPVARFSLKTPLHVLHGGESDPAWSHLDEGSSQVEQRSHLPHDVGISTIHATEPIQ